MTDLCDRVHCSDNIEFLRTLPDESISAVVTDPPYGLSFMGKKWDYDVPSIEVWAECLRVLKPGGHLLAFAGTRTQHRMAVNIEDAGFDIRDMIAWVYGSGFPKGLDVSKAIDKGTGENRERQLRFTAWMRSTGITAQEINEATGSSMASHYLTDNSQPAIATADMFDKMRPYLPEVPEEIERLVAERTGIEWTAYKMRPVVGSRRARDTKKQRIACAYSAQGYEKPQSHILELTAPATNEAKKWDGWGTALKPALEPITVARKPIIGTVAGNVLKHGTGGINIDGCRVGERFPANIIHDDGDEITELLGDAKRFFYCPKASTRDRDEGAKDRNRHPTVKPTDLMRYLCRLVTPPDGIVLDPFAGSGSTGKAAVMEYFQFIGVEREAEYCEIANARIQYAKQRRRMKF